jgi:cysteine synthase
MQTEEAQTMARTLAQREGLLAGVSGGANVAAALRVAEHAAAGSVIVTVLPDSGERYLTEPWWEEHRQEEM